MIDLSWTIEKEREDDLAEPPRPVLSTWHYLRSSLRRRWRTVAGLASLGLLLGLGIVVATPPGTVATVTLLMAHPADMDESAASATDVSLLNTRVVADRTVRALGLSMTPESFRSTVTASPVTPAILAIRVSGPDEASAEARGRELVRQYLDFRATQLTALSSGLRAEYAARIAAAQQQQDELAKQFDKFNAQGALGASRAFDVLARRTDLNRKIAGWQESVDSATLQTGAAIQSTHVIDPVHADVSSARRAAVLAAASGLIAGGALGAGIVLFRALVSERMRRRKDIGIALGTSVRFSVRSPGPPAPRAGVRRLLPSRGAWRGDDLTALSLGLEWALDLDAVTASSEEATGRGPGPGATVALAAIGNARAAADVVAATATRLREHGTGVFLVDLTRPGFLAGAALPDGQNVWRPSGIPELARGPRGASPPTPVDLPGDSWRADWVAADVALALVEVDPGIAVHRLATWVERVVPLVTAGAATAELLSTAADLVREAGLGLPFAMMAGCDTTDESLGIIDALDAEMLQEAG